MFVWEFMTQKPSSSSPVSLLLTNDFPPIVSGISTLLYQLYVRQKKGAVQVITVETEGSEEVDRQAPLQVVRLPLTTDENLFAKVWKTLSGMFFVVRVVQKGNIKKIHCGQILSNGLAALLCRKLFFTPYLVWVYGSETLRMGDRWYLAYLMRKILKEADEVISISDFTTQEYLDFGVDAAKIVKITPGVDINVFTPQKKPEHLLKKYELEGKTVMLTIARLDQRKGHDMALYALSQVAEEFPDLHYIIGGRGREEKRLREIVKEKQLEERVHFAGFIPDDELPGYYNLADFFILPNRDTEGTMLQGDYEGFGIVFVEAGACGKPVIGGLSGGVADAVEDGVSGFLVNGQSEEEIKEAIVKLVQDASLREQMGKAGRKRAETLFDWDGLSRKLGEVL